MNAQERIAELAAKRGARQFDLFDQKPPTQKAAVKKAEPTSSEPRPTRKPAPIFKPSETRQRVEDLKESGEDFEWYPTTNKIVRQVANDIRRVRDDEYRYDRSRLDVMDIGAGDGRVLIGIKEELHDEEWSRSVDVDNLFAIEISTVHLTNMPKEIVILGTDFREQTLVDKPASVVFCNPPYSEFEDWAYRILRECSAPSIYLVIPRRWRDSARLKDAIESRKIEMHSLGEFDFENADRQARAKVEVVRFSVPGGKGDSAFDAAIEEMLPELEKFDRELPREDSDELPQFTADMIEAKGGIIPVMVEAYDQDLAKLVKTYRAVVKIEPAILKELGVSKSTILEGLRTKTSGLKNKYWKSLFEHLKDITKRLATKQRDEFLKSLTDKSVIDFTESNIYAMLIWITKWASDHFDQQLIDLFKAMAQKATVEKYKSNQKVWKDGNWRYLNDEATHYKLCYRMVLETHGGIYRGSYGEWENPNGLCKCSHELLNDFVTVANNLGFECDDSTLNHQWESNGKVEFYLRDGSLLLDVRAFINGNLHIRVAKSVMLAINVKAGALLGWLNSADEAVSELQAEADADFVREIFATSQRIEVSNLLKLEHKA